MYVSIKGKKVSGETDNQNGHIFDIFERSSPAEKAKPKMAGNKSFKEHNELAFFRTRLRKELGKKNRI